MPTRTFTTPAHFSRSLVLMGSLGRQLDAARAGVRIALADHRRNQARRVRFDWTPSVAKSRAWVRSRIALLRDVEELIDAEAPRLASLVVGQDQQKEAA